MGRRMELCPAHLINFFLSTLFMYLPTRQPPCLCCDSLIIFFILWKNIEKFVLHSPLSYQEYVRPILHKSNLDVVVITVIVVTTKTKVENETKADQINDGNIMNKNKGTDIMYTIYI